MRGRWFETYLCIVVGNTQEAVALSRHDCKIVDWDVKPQHKSRIIQLSMKSKQLINIWIVKIIRRFKLNPTESGIHPAHNKCHCLHFNIYEHDKFHAPFCPVEHEEVLEPQDHVFT